MTDLIRIDAPHFVAGVIVRYPARNLCAPIVSYMSWWDEKRIKEYCVKKKWKCEEVEHE